jgi:hypothetical protein
LRSTAIRRTTIAALVAGVLVRREKGQIPERSIENQLLFQSTSFKIRFENLKTSSKMKKIKLSSTFSASVALLPLLLQNLITVVYDGRGYFE